MKYLMILMAVILVGCGGATQADPGPTLGREYLTTFTIASSYPGFCTDFEDFPAMVKVFYTECSRDENDNIVLTENSKFEVEDMEGNILVSCGILADGSIDFDWGVLTCNGEMHNDIFYGAYMQADCVTADNETCSLGYYE